MAKRNPGINWASPIQEQTPRQQARFLLLVEQAAVIRKGFSPSCSVVANPIARAVLETAGVPLDQLDGQQGKLTYSCQLDDVLKTPWKENKKHPHFAVMDHTKEILFGLSCAVSRAMRLKDEPYSNTFEEAASKESKYFLDGRLPTVTLAYRHLIADYAKALISNGGNLKEAGLWFDPASLAAINHAVGPVTAQLEAEAEAIRDQRRAEYRERFGHQPSTGNDDAEFREGAYEAFGMTMEEWLAKHLSDQSTGSSLAGRGTALPADYRALGLSPGASQADIQMAFRQLVKEHHPDAGGDARRFQVVADAYSRLREVVR